MRVSRAKKYQFFGKFYVRIKWMIPFIWQKLSYTSRRWADGRQFKLIKCMLQKFFLKSVKIKLFKRIFDKVWGIIYVQLFLEKNNLFNEAK